VSKQIPVVPQPPNENKENIIEGPTINGMPGAFIDNNETETKSQVDDISKLFGPDERFTGDYLLQLDLKDDENLVEKLIPYGETSLLAGPGDTGKTTFYFQLSTSITTKQQDFIGRKINAKYNSVLIIATEDSKKSIADKLQKQIKKIAPGVIIKNNFVVHVTGDDLFKRLRTELNHKNFDLVVLDALGDLLLDDINSQSVVRTSILT